MAIATYYIAQRVPDVFRKECHNVGVIVKWHDRFSSRFLGEVIRDGSLEMDSRKLKNLSSPDVYRQWVSYWRRTIDTNANPIDEIKASSKGNYRIVDGGELFDVPGDDEVENMVAYVYGLLVSENGIAEALDTEADEEIATKQFRTVIAEKFRESNLLNMTGQSGFTIHHPIQQNVDVPDENNFVQTVTFLQNNGRSYVIEPLNVSSAWQQQAKTNMLSLAYQFSKLRNSPALNNPVLIAVVKARPDLSLTRSVRNAESYLAKEADEVVNWQSPDERDRFIADRRRIAVAPE